ncbi:hypothetical protein [Natranaerobius thermophilus]|uniref:Uncharacterized protein n=1 Tax=Natranaerobius thermophilus (strain ATCC BAA-1301 / DSM 18059 / JW/NM-WN-LF) TaxID=457570 RepID=B2A107_NATTJ|nr:hypothetical protein [Natranaerobius thermophilus]ACB84630.1 hypothetical protein Nther_1046 [Natranaerobius thermophilus JW/NM-WN-LF]
MNSKVGLILSNILTIILFISIASLGLGIIGAISSFFIEEEIAPLNFVGTLIRSVLWVLIYLILLRILQNSETKLITKENIQRLQYIGYLLILVFLLEGALTYTQVLEQGGNLRILVAGLFSIFLSESLGKEVTS